MNLNNIKKRISEKINKALVNIFKLNKKITKKNLCDNYETEILGTPYGGWFIPKNILDKNSICYLVGAGEDISFDCELVEKYNCKAFIFDPTPRAKKHFKDLVQNISTGCKMTINNSENRFYKIPKEKLNLLNYYDYGVWSKTEIKKFFVPPKEAYVSHSIANLAKTEKYFEAQCKTIQDIMLELNHKKIDLLKLDVEGAEYEIIDSILKDDLNIKILCLEFDEIPLNSIKTYFKTRKMLTNILNSGFKLIHQNDSDFVFVKK